MNHKTLIKVALVIADESYCKRRKVGAILVKDGNIISIGYNGTISGFKNICEDESGNTKKEVLHAESNAIIKCAVSNYSSKGSVMYTTLSPCLDCAKLIIQCGVTSVYYLEEYTDLSGISLLQKSNINVERVFL